MAAMNLDRNEVIDWFIDAISTSLSVSETEIDPSHEFFRLGLNSLDLLEIIQNFKKHYGIEVQVNELFDYPSVELLAEYLSSQSKSLEVNPIEAGRRQLDFSNDPIAIIGFACRFPGKAHSGDLFWDLLEGSRSAIKEIPKERFSSPSVYHAYAGLLEEDVSSFDCKHFELSPREAKGMDPQQRLLMSLSWEALENAGYSPKAIKGSDTGVFVGISTADYSLEIIQSGQKPKIFEGIGTAHSIAANRISYFYGFHGPSLAFDTACSSSLVSIYNAVETLRLGKCQVALAGGVNLILSSFLTDAFSDAGMLSPDGKCRSFSEGANGYVRGEGGAFLVLKPLKLAIEDGNHIHALIRGGAINQDGRTNTLTSPNRRAQVAVIKEALRDSGLKANDIDYVEAHGTGTPLGDPIEYHALTEVFGNNLNPLKIGSVKTNIGHLEAAAGIAGVIKVLLSLRNSKIPQNLNFTQLNSEIEKNPIKLHIPLKHESWESLEGRPRRAGISSFGFGGTNSHLILEEAPKKEFRIRAFSYYKKPDYLPFILSASCDESLRETEKRFRNFLKDSENIDFVDLCHNLYTKRSQLNCGSAIIAENTQSLIRLLDEEKLKKIEKSKSNLSRKRVAFLFSGQGSQYPQMGVELYGSQRVFTEALDQCFEAFQPYYGEKIQEILFSQDREDLGHPIYETDIGQALIFSIEYALFTFWKHLGLGPDYLIGHSLGEIIAVACAGGLTLRDAAELIYWRGEFMQKSKPGKMLVIMDSWNEAFSRIQNDFPNISLACKNGPHSFVVSGKEEDIQNLEKTLSLSQIKFKALSNNRAFHSSLMDDVLVSFREKISSIAYQKLNYLVVSCVDGHILSQEDLTSEFWVNHIRHTVDFQEACKTIDAKKVTHLLEIGPHPVLIPMALSCLERSNPISVESLNKKEKSWKTLSVAIAKLSVDGFKLNLSELTKDYYSKNLELPTTAFASTRYWLTKNPTSESLSESENSNKERPDRVEIVNRMKQIISDEVGIPFSEISESDPLLNIGADSIVLLGVLERLNDDYGVKIKTNRIFEDLNTLSAISSFIQLEIENDLPAHQFKKPTSIKDSSRELGEGSKKGVLGNFSRKALVNAESDPLNPYLEELVQDFSSKTKSSKEHAERYRKPLADNRVSAGFRPQIKEILYPIICDRANGAYFWDLDGNQYTDFTMGFGVNLFGHSPKFIQDSLRSQLDRGLAIGPQSLLAGEVAELFCELTGSERVAFLNSGTEAVMTAIRLARAKTTRSKIVIFEGSYHGHFDGVLGRQNNQGETVPVASGIPESYVRDDLIVLDYGTEETLNKIMSLGNELAAVLVEPVQSRYPEIQPEKFLKRLRAITAENGTALIFDEVITGFRAAIGGAQEYFGVKADLGSYGKILGGGMPIGAIGGSSEYLDFIDGGEWHFGDQSFPKNEITFFAGTFCKHPLAMTAALEVLKLLKIKGTEILENLNKKTEKLASELNHYFTLNQIPLEIVYFSSLFRFKFKRNMDPLFFDLNRRGQYIWEGRNLFLSTAHSEEDIRGFIETIKLVVQNQIDSGLIEPHLEETKKEANTFVSYSFLDSHRRFKKLLVSDNKESKLASQIFICSSFEGNLNLSAMKKAIQLVLGQFDSLHAKYDMENEKIIFSSPIGREFSIRTYDLSASSDPKKIALDLLNNNSFEVLDPEKSPVKVDMIKMSEELYWIGFAFHHMVMDGLSSAFVFDELAKAYNGLCDSKTPQLKEVYPFREYLEDQNLKKIKSDPEFFIEESEKWGEKLFPKSDLISDYSGKRIKFSLNPEEYKAVKFFGYKNKSSLFVTLFIVFAKEVMRFFERNTIVIGVPYMGHDSIDSSMVGNCVNLLPYCLNVKDFEKSLPEIIEAIKEYQLKLNRNSDLSMQEIEKLTGKSPIEVVFNVEPVTKLPKFKGLKTEIEYHPVHASEYPIMINAMRLESTLHVEMDIQTPVVSELKAQELFEKFRKSLISLGG